MTEYNETREFDEYPLPKVGELPDAYGKRVQAWASKSLHRAARAERRLVRIETRLTMALRFLGLHPGVGAVVPVEPALHLDVGGLEHELHVQGLAAVFAR